jgi:HEAT repeat protein
MGTAERNQIISEIAKQEPTSVFHAWIDAGRVDRDPMKQMVIGFTLSEKLRTSPGDSGVYNEIQGFIADSSNSFNERGKILIVLGEAKTKASLDLLIQAATTLPDKGLKMTAASEVNSSGSLWGDGKFHEELSPALERIWQKSDDRYLLNSAAFAIAKIGAPSGVQLLLSAALSEAPSDAPRKRIAQFALQEVLNSHAVPILTELLVDNPPTSERSELAASILDEMGAPDAARSLINWLKTTDESAAPLAKSYVVRTRSRTMVKAFRAALDPSVAFYREQNREAIREGLAEYDASRR